MEEIAKVDNESGLLKGDVTVGRIQYAVKGIKAQTLGLQQIINVAQQIMNQANYAKENLQQVKEDFHKKANSRNHIQKMEKDVLNGWLDDLGKQIQKRNAVSMDTLIKFQPERNWNNF